MKKYVFVAIAGMMMVSCQNEIDFDFGSVDAQLAVEGLITNQGVNVKLSKTVNMDDTIQNSSYHDARVMISGNDGSSEQLTCDNQGIYHAVTGLKGVPGVTYTLTVQDAGHTYTSTSVMQDTTAIKSTGFTWKKIVSEELLCYNYQIQDVPNVDNWYCYRMYKNHEMYKWGLFDDAGFKNNIISNSVTCMSRKDYDNNDEDKQDEIIHDGDSIQFDIMVIDKNTYDYLYSLKLSAGNKANPVKNFEGECLGYFSACSICTVKEKFVYLP